MRTLNAWWPNEGEEVARLSCICEARQEEEVLVWMDEEEDAPNWVGCEGKTKGPTASPDGLHGKRFQTQTKGSLARLSSSTQPSSRNR